jgi:thiol-disulfide isomerase/thioredoxin
MGLAENRRAILMRIFLIASLLLPWLALAQISRANPACEPNPQAEKALRQAGIRLNEDMDELARQRPVIASLLAQYPDDLAVNLQYQLSAKYGPQAPRTAMLEKYREMAEKNPGRPQYQYLYARALDGTDTPKAMDLLKGIVASDPAYPWPHLGLAESYSWGKFDDGPKLLRELDSFLSACPVSLNEEAEQLAAKKATPEMAAHYAKNLRARLMKEHGREHMRDWQVVWDLEFKAVPPTEHDAVRKQIADDLQRMEKLARQPNADELVLLNHGYTLAGDQTSARRTEQELLPEYPQNEHAKDIVNERWWKEHSPAPKPGDPADKKTAYYQSELRLVEEQLKSSPNNELLLFERFQGLSELDGSNPEQIIAAADAWQSVLKKYQQWNVFAAVEIGRVFVRRHIKVEEVPSLIQQGQDASDQYPTMFSDHEDEKLNSDFIEQQLSVKLDAANVLLDSARELGKPELATAAMAQAAGLAPKKPENQAKLLAVKANYAEQQGHKLDALLMYRAALELRPANAYLGDTDELAEKEERLWKELGGTAATLGLWKHKTAVATNGPWQKPSKDMPDWELTDLQGKTWNPASFRGKTVFINVWASWCGSCREEHPYLQKLYDKLKDRPDIQILTFDTDEEIGAVAPYVKQNRYSFPVLLAQEYFQNLYEWGGIPQNWIVDANGKRLWEQVGFDVYDRWVEDALQKIEESKLKQQ